jgi:hypothetical protein
VAGCFQRQLQKIRKATKVRMAMENEEKQVESFLDDGFASSAAYLRQLMTKVPQLSMFAERICRAASGRDGWNGPSARVQRARWRESAGVWRRWKSKWRSWRRPSGSKARPFLLLAMRPWGW